MSDNSDSLRQFAEEWRRANDRMTIQLEELRAEGAKNTAVSQQMLKKVARMGGRMGRVPLELRKTNRRLTGLVLVALAALITTPLASSPIGRLIIEALWKRVTG